MNIGDQASAADRVHAAAPAPAIKDATLRMLAWARLWSPLADEPALRAIWQTLGLPGSFEAQRIEYWNTFHAGMPQPPVPLQLHALLQCEGGNLRETLLRVAEHLEVEMSARRLPPDHLALVCELYALAIEREEPVLVEGLAGRYLLPWVQAALAALPAEQSAMRVLLQVFADDAQRAAA